MTEAKFMRDRVAEAIARAAVAGQDFGGQAVAAITAMRDPTLSMVEAGQEVNNILPEPHSETEWQGLSRDEITEAWQAMIDEALA